MIKISEIYAILESITHSSLKNIDEKLGPGGFNSDLVGQKKECALY